MVFLGFIISMVSIKYNQTFKLKRISVSKKILFVFFIILFATLFVGISRVKSEIHLRKAYEERAKGYWLDDIDELDKAYSANFKMDFVSTPIDWYKGEAYFNLKRVDEAFNCFIAAKNINPYHMHVLNNLGTCYEIKGMHDSAIYYFNKALLFTDYFEDALFNLCAVHFNMKNYVQSIIFLQKIKPSTDDNRYPKFSKLIIEKYLTQLIDTTKDVTVKKIFSQYKGR